MSNLHFKTVLESAGFALVEGVDSKASLLALADSLGRPVPSPGGEIVKEIRVMPQGKATPGSQSARHGTGAFPLHTDTVFWPEPVRYVILRGCGDTRRPTMVLGFAELLERYAPTITFVAAQSAWTVWTGSSSIFCSLLFGEGQWRYDPDLMRPANETARKIDAVLRPLAGRGLGHSVHWSGNTALVLANWRVLHGRGPQPPDEGERIIERIYVR